MYRWQASALNVNMRRIMSEVATANRVETRISTSRAGIALLYPLIPLITICWILAFDPRLLGN